MAAEVGAEGGGQYSVPSTSASSSQTTITPHSLAGPLHKLSSAAASSASNTTPSSTTSHPPLHTSSESGTMQAQQHASASTSTSTPPRTAAASTRDRGSLGTAGRPLHHKQALSAIRAFLRRESCFDILPESFRLIVLDNKLLIKRALVALQSNGTFRCSR